MMASQVRRRAVHGSRGRYNNGCRCAECRSANRDYAAARRRAAGMRPQAEVSAEADAARLHGTSAMYHRGCRCAECNGWNTADVARRRSGGGS